MRYWPISVLLLASACQQQAKAPSKSSPIAFDGAEATDAAALRRHGERLVHVLGCTGCHGDGLEGEQFAPQMKQYGSIYASNLTIASHEYGEAQLDGVIRHGVHPERNTVWVMPSQIFQRLSDSDFHALIAYLRSLKPAGKKFPPPRFNALDRKEIAAGKFKPAVQMVKEDAPHPPIDPGPQYALGRYIASVTCSECHGPALEGHPGDPNKPPNLIVAGGYSRAEFERLITQGIPTGGRTLKPMMVGVAKYRFSRLTPHERDALYAYLKARAEKP